mmetsp:Transcript_9290/g.15292  ORF Transcript_9290/g.15292 Transcript_9290/m.15292 type:complete len:218 (+) Transcript_9290:160-813(+)
MLILQSCIFLQKCTNSSIDWLQLFKTLAGNLDWVSSSRQDGEVMPRCGFSRVVDPVRFAIHISENDLSSTKVKLLDFHRYLLSSMGLFHCSIVVGLVVKHVHCPLIRNNPPNNNILLLPLIRILGSFHIKRIILDQMLILGQNHFKIGIKASNIQRPRTSTNKFSAVFRISNRLAIHFEYSMSQQDSRVVRRRIFRHIRNNWTGSHGFNCLPWYLLK